MCEDCQHAFETGESTAPRRIFLSYGHDEHAVLAGCLKTDLERRGHEVWFDIDRLKPGGDWERYIEEGLDWVSEVPANGRVILLMTPHSVRRPDGYCLNEIARALARRVTVVPVMVVWSEPPLSICRIQWLDMQDCVPIVDRAERYERKFERLVEALEQDRLDFEGAQARLLQLLEPLPFEADVAQHLSRFVGRGWVFDAIDDWLAYPEASRVFWLTGKPGVGKTAIAAWLCYRRRELAAFHLCRHGHTQKADPRRCVLSIAYQLSSQLPDYEARLNSLDLESLIAESNARTLFDALIVQPLSGNFPRPERDVVILIDALDEATEGGRNELASFIASEFARTPDWLRLIITSRPEPEVTQPLQGLTPYMLDTSAPENEGDLREYLNREFASLAGGGDATRAAIEGIIQRSEGVFLYVRWVCDELAQGRLSIERLEDFPRGLGGVYQQFFERQFPLTRDESGRAVPPGTKEEFETRVRPALEAIVAAREPLELAMLASMFRWSDYDRRDFCGSLGSLFTIEDGRIRPFHQSVIEWLTASERAGAYYVSVGEGHRRLADYGLREYDKGSTSAMSAYSLAHLPAHLTWGGERVDELVALLTDLRWLEAKAECGLTFDLPREFDEALRVLPGDHPRRRILGLLHQGIRRDIHFMARHPSTLFQCLWNSGWWYDCPEAASHYASPKGPWSQAGEKLSTLLDTWRAEKERATPGFRWVRALRPPAIPLNSAELAVLRGHEGRVQAVAVAPDGRRVVSGSGDGTVRVWDLGSGAELAVLRGHEDRVMSVAVAPDGRRAVTGGRDGMVRVWDLESGSELAVLRGARGRVLSVAVAPDGRRVVSGSSGGTVRVWDIDRGAELAALRGHGGAVASVAVAPDGRRVVSGSGDRTVRVWDLESGAELAALRGHADEVRSVAVAPDGRRVVSGSGDGTARVWDLEDGVELAVLRGHEDWVESVAVAPDGRRIVSASGDGTVRVWDIEGGAELVVLRGHEDWVESVAVAPDGRRVVSGSGDGTVRVWHIERGAKQAVLRGHEDEVRSVAVAPDGRRVVSGSYDRMVRIWDIENGAELAVLRGHEAAVESVAVAPDGPRVVSGSGDGTVRVWDIESGAELGVLRGHEYEVKSVAVAPDGRRVVSGSYDKTVRVWDIESRAELAVLRGHEGWVWSVAVAPDGLWVVSGSTDGTVRVWDIERGAELVVLRGHEAWVESLAVAPDGRRVVSGNDDLTVRVWDIRSGRCLEAIRARGDVRAIAAGPSRYPFRALSRNQETVIEDGETGTALAWYEAPLKHLATSPSGCIWVGAVGSHVHIVTLEGES